MIERKKTRGRPKKKGQRNTKVIYLRPWTYHEIKKLSSLFAVKTPDETITRLISIYKKQQTTTTTTTINKNA